MLLGRTAQAGVASVNDRQLNETRHCSERLFDLLAVGQNLSGASQPGPQATVCIDSGGDGEEEEGEVGRAGGSPPSQRGRRAGRTKDVH